jgi:hypothetical protein
MPMTRMSWCRRWVHIAGAGVLSIVLTGCGGSAPDGWARVDLDGASVAHPEGWDPFDDELGRWEYGVVDDASDPRIHLVATGALGDDRYADSASGRLVAGAQLYYPAFRIRDVEEIEIDGASSAERTRFRYEDEDGREVHGVWLVAADREAGRSVAVQVTAHRLDDELVHDLQRELRLTDRTGPVGDVGEAPVEG